LDRAPAF